jgi:hypothetical protein
LTVEDNELLAEEGVLSGELGISASDVEGRAKKDRIARRPGGDRGKPVPEMPMRSACVG